MVYLKSVQEVALMKKSAEISIKCMNEVKKHIKVGISTFELDKIVEDIILCNNALPSFKGYHGYPSTINASINEEVVHGLPGKRKLRDGDIIGIDLGTKYKGYHSDMARTFMVGNIEDDVCKLVKCAKLSYMEALKVMHVGNRLGDIGYAIQKCAQDRGFSVVRTLCGHGIGKDLHEDPEVLNFGRRNRGLRLRAGMVLAVEPMINMGTHEVKSLADGWTIVTADMKPSSHYENTVYITQDGPIELTRI